MALAEMRERVGNDPLPVARVPSSRPLAARLWPAGLRREFVEGLLEGTVGGFLCKSSCEMVVPVRRRVVGRVITRGGVLGGAVGGWRVFGRGAVRAQGLEQARGEAGGVSVLAVQA